MFRSLLVSEFQNLLVLGGSRGRDQRVDKLRNLDPIQLLCWLSAHLNKTTFVLLKLQHAGEVLLRLKLGTTGCASKKIGNAQQLPPRLRRLLILSSPSSALADPALTSF